MSQKYEKLKALLQELFQLDQPDLDFGIYRVFHVKADEITNFLDRDLLPQVKSAYQQYKSADKAEIEHEIEQAVAAANSLGVDAETSPTVKQLRERLANESVDINKLEGEVYDHLYSFFRRYYSEGDFLSKRVYKPGVYAIPYEGEEVKLHWANADQYYIKTSEYLRDYAFRLNPEADEGKGEDPMRVHFRLVDAAEGEHGNVKEAEGKTRVLILAGGDFVTEQDGKAGKELVIAFGYRPATLSDWPADQRDGKKKPPAQKELLEIAEKRILATENAAFVRWIAEVRKSHIKADGEQADYSRLRAHLNRYAARNTFDYFIHKDLGGFLRRELDFYIKNEVMHLDDIEGDTAPRVEQYLSKIKVIRSIAHKIIDFLAQIEDFQKKLWLKKKFVVETSYLIRVGVIPEEFYPEIAANGVQREEWVRFLAIDEIEGDLNTPGYSDPLTEDFLRASPTLLINTSHFSWEFTQNLLEQLGDREEVGDGFLIHSENRQALSVVEKRFKNSIECIHIDPPYNTQTSGFLYRNSYQHSSWLAMMAERLALSAELGSDTHSLLIHIDENEYERLFQLCEDLGLPNAGTLIWNKGNPMLGRKGLATQHEYVLWRSSAPGSVYLRNANQRLILSKSHEFIQEFGGVNDDSRRAFASWIAACPQLSGGEKAYKHIDDAGKVYRPVSMSAGTPSTDPRYFRPLTHPVTGQPTPVPPTGWSRPPETFERLLEDGLIIFGPDHTTLPQLKLTLTEDSRRQMPSVYQDTGRGKTDMINLGLEFPYSHPVSLYTELVGAATDSDDAIVLDYFAGSGTNGHAVIQLNREEGTERRFVLTEIGDQFDEVMIPRLIKATFSPKWKDGKPERLATAEEAERSPDILKIIRLESYEDALNNLELRRTARQDGTLFSNQADGQNGFRERYMLQYMLDVESRGSQSLLNIANFAEPTGYKLKVKSPGSDESREVNVDLIETFNWLIGLTVQHIAAPRIFSADFERDSEGRLKIAGRLRQDANGPFWFRTVTGNTPDGRKTLVIWRKLTGNPEEDNLVLDEWFTRQGYSSKDIEFDLIYVNGDNNLENLRAPDDTSWKVRLIEEDFHRLMFDTEDV